MASVANIDSISNAAGTGPVAFPNGLSVASGAISRGTYTPTFSNLVNITGSITVAVPWWYIRVGDTVFVGGSMDLTPTAGGGTSTVADFTLPVPLNTAFSSIHQLGGAGAGVVDFVRFISDTGPSNQLGSFAFNSQGTSAETIAFTYSYQII